MQSWIHPRWQYDHPGAWHYNDPTKGVQYNEVVARQKEPYLHPNMAQQVDKTWTWLCESKHPCPKAPLSRWTEGAEFRRNLGNSQLEVVGHCAHLVVAPWTIWRSNSFWAARNSARSSGGGGGCSDPLPLGCTKPSEVPRVAPTIWNMEV